MALNVWRLPTRRPAPRPAGPCSRPTTSLHPAGKPLKAAQRPPLCYPECAPPPPAEGGRGPELSADKRFDSGRALDAADTGTMRPAPHQLLPREPGVPGSSIAPVPRNRWIRGGEGNNRFTPQRASAFRITFSGARRGAQRRVPPAQVPDHSPCTLSGGQGGAAVTALLSGVRPPGRQQPCAPSKPHRPHQQRGACLAHRLLERAWQRMAARPAPCPAKSPGRDCPLRPRAQKPPARGGRGGTHACSSAHQRIPDNVSSVASDK